LNLDLSGVLRRYAAFGYRDSVYPVFFAHLYNGTLYSKATEFNGSSSCKSSTLLFLCDGYERARLRQRSVFSWTHRNDISCDWPSSHWRIFNAVRYTPQCVRGNVQGGFGSSCESNRSLNSCGSEESGAGKYRDWRSYRLVSFSQTTTFNSHRLI